MEENKVNAIVNLGQMKVAEKAYDDAISTPAKNLGTALGTIADIGNTILWPVKWLNERTKLYFQNNLKKYEEKLSQIQDENVVPVPTEISMPILERFTYVSNEKLSDAFVNLLTTASSTETIGKAHPGFIYVIDRLSPDEAKILQYLKSNLIIPRLDVNYHEDGSSSNFQMKIIGETLLDELVEIQNRGNRNLYIDNLVSLGILTLEDHYYLDLEELYERMKAKYKKQLDELRKEGTSDSMWQRQIQHTKRMYVLTNYGKLFIEACIQ